MITILDARPMTSPEWTGKTVDTVAALRGAQPVER
jgi:hypothetical protein